MAIFSIFEAPKKPKKSKFRKNEKKVRGYSSGVPRKPYLARFEQTRGPQIWGNYVTKNPIFGFWAIFRGLIRATDTIFGKSEKYIPGYLSGVPKKPYMAKIEQTHDPQI